MKLSKEEKLANKWINQMIEFGLEPEQMIKVLELAREKLNFLKEAERVNIYKSIHSIATTPEGRISAKVIGKNGNLPKYITIIKSSN